MACHVPTAPPTPRCRTPTEATAVPTKDQIKRAKQTRKTFFDDPARFASKTVILTAYTNAVGRAAGGQVRFAMLRTDDYTAKTFHGDDIPVFVVVDGTGYGDGAFDGYWCPYEQDSVKSTTVWRHGNALFTDKMDGCTFGVGSVGANGAVRVCHVNQSQYQVSSADTALMEQHQHDDALAELGVGATLLEPSKYRRKQAENEKVAATTFGVRDKNTNTWSFYAQLYTGGGMSPFVLRGLKKVA
jgi:hypothetical protein